MLLQFSDQRFCDRPAEAERVWFAALKSSGGDLARLTKAIEVANGDYRDPLLGTGFASDPKGHLKWWPGQTTPARLMHRSCRHRELRPTFNHAQQLRRFLNTYFV